MLVELQLWLPAGLDGALPGVQQRQLPELDGRVHPAARPSRPVPRTESDPCALLPRPDADLCTLLFSSTVKLSGIPRDSWPREWAYWLLRVANQGVEVRENATCVINCTCCPFPWLGSGAQYYCQPRRVCHSHTLCRILCAF